MWDEYYLCEDVEEALSLLHHFNGEARVIAGGTDLMIDLETSQYRPTALIDITRIRDLQGVSQKGNRIFIGSAATMSQVIRSELILQYAPHLVKSIRTIAGRQIRNVATVVGNIVNASPAADTAPVLYTLDARVHFYDERKSECELPISQFINGVKTTVLPSEGLVTAISFQLPENGWHTSFRKLGLRWSMAISVVNASIALLEKDGLIQDARIAFGAVAPTPVRSMQAEQELIGMSLDKAAISDAPRLARATVSPIDDFRASASYRLQMVENILREELRNLSGIDSKENYHDC